MKFDERTDVAKLRRQADAIYIEVDKPIADDIAISLIAAADEIEFLRPKYNEAAELVRRANAERLEALDKLSSAESELASLRAQFENIRQWAESGDGWFHNRLKEKLMEPLK